MQLSAKLKNKSTAWSALLKVRVLDVVLNSGNYYQNVSGINGALTDTSHWFLIYSPGVSGSVAITVNKTASDIIGSDPDYQLDLSAAGLPNFPASVSVYVDLTGSGDFEPVDGVNYSPVTGILHAMNSPTDFAAQIIKIIAI